MTSRPFTRYLKWPLFGLVVVFVSFLVVRTWIVPALIVRQIQARLGGRVEIHDWWMNGSSVGVKGLKVFAGPGSTEPPWATAPRVWTDLTLSNVLRGRFAPSRVMIERPEVVVDLDKSGKVATKVGGKASPAGPMPVVIASGAKVTLRQEGRPPMVIPGITARLGPDGKRLLGSVRSNDPTWGPLEAQGDFDPSLTSGTVVLKTLQGVTASPEKARSLLFVPLEIWDHVEPTGTIDATLNVGFDPTAIHSRTVIRLRQTTVVSKTLDVTAASTTGHVIVDDGVVTFDNVAGQAVDGHVKANGKADFSKSPPRFDVGLKLQHINVSDAPKAWQLHEAGVTGRLSGDVRLQAILKTDGVDLSGTTGEAVVTGGTIQGIPFKSLKLVMNANGNDLQYDTPKATSGSIPRLWPAPTAGLLVAFQPPVPDSDARKSQPPGHPKIELPHSMTTQLELEDVELSELIAKATYFLGFPFPLPITGQLTLKAEATIPLGKARNLRDYAFHGDLSLKRASAYNVDLGRLSARIDLANGVLDLTNVRGRLIDKPNGGPANPPKIQGEIVPLTGPLPAGGFRGALHATIDPPGKLTARFEGVDLPLGEVSAPALPRPTPLSGLATMNVEASVDLSAATDPAAWNASGTVESRHIRYQDAALDKISVHFSLKNGQLEFSDLSAQLANRPLRAWARLDLKPPQTYQGAVDVTEWDLSETLAWLPTLPKHIPLAGNFSARAEASGTLSPFRITTDGRGSFERFHAGPLAIGVIPFHWTTQENKVAFTIKDAHPFGGLVSADVNIPIDRKGEIDGNVKMDAVDLAALSASIPGSSPVMTGKANGSLSFSVPPDAAELRATVKLKSSDMTVQNIPAEHVMGQIHARNGVIDYELSAESLGGIVKFRGDLPQTPKTRTLHAAEGELQVAGFTLGRLWKALGFTGLIAQLDGQGAVDANMRAILEGPSAGLYAHGVTEIRELKWGLTAGLGRLRGIMRSTPAGWRIDPINGDLLGGTTTGVLWGSSANADPGRGIGFEVKLDRASLRTASSLLSGGRFSVEGVGTMRLAGTLGETLRLNGELDVPGSRFLGLPLSELKVPAELSTSGDNRSGVVHVRHWSARLAGGHVHGDAWFHLGAERAFQSEFQLADVDLESIARIESDVRRPATGKISGKISLNGPDPLATKNYRGRVVLDLDDASLVAIPIFRELDKFLGSARGGLFEDGDLAGTIANRQLIIESATLEGRLAQLHITGSVGFDQQLNLEVLVNTNQIISQAGQSLASVIPGFRSSVARNHDATAQVTSFLSNRLLKLRVTGTLRNPSVSLDPGIGVESSAVGFFSGVLKLPMGNGR